MAKRNAVGIDLGTTYSCVGTFQHGKVEIIANDQGNRTTPSYVGFTDTERLIGDAAKNQVAVNPTNTIFDAKRLIGRKFDDDTVKSDMKHWPFEVIEHCGLPRLKVEYMSEEKVFTPEEISSMVLTKMKDTAEAYLGTAVTEAVITVRYQMSLLKLPACEDHIGCICLTFLQCAFSNASSRCRPISTTARDRRRRMPGSLLVSPFSG